MDTDHTAVHLNIYTSRPGQLAGSRLTHAAMVLYPQGATREVFNVLCTTTALFRPVVYQLI